jgi:hypothetical protein
MMKILSFATFCILQLTNTGAFAPASISSKTTASSSSLAAKTGSNISRRDILNNLSIASIVSFGILSSSIPEPANASGGATAGGVYLLSAKQRYNARVQAGVKGFAVLESGLDSGSLDSTKAFFTADNTVTGAWKDASAAGYLLANAFRRSSTTPPDSLPTVKKWKAFAAEMEVLQKALKKKDAKGAKASYEKGTSLLDAYLESVELPPVIELK